MDGLEETLLKAAGILNGLKIKWNVGGSVLLAHFNLHENPHDIDIVVAKEDIGKAKAALEGIGTQKHVPESDIFVSDHYYKFDIDGVEADLIAGFKIRHDNGVYEYKPDFCRGKGSFNESKVFYAALEDWFVLYLMMPGGTEKAEKIEKYFMKSENADKEKLNKILEAGLPQNAAYRISELIKKA